MIRSIITKTIFHICLFQILSSQLSLAITSIFFPHRIATCFIVMHFIKQRSTNIPNASSMDGEKKHNFYRMHNKYSVCSSQTKSLIFIQFFHLSKGDFSLSKNMAFTRSGLAQHFFASQRQHVNKFFRQPNMRKTFSSRKLLRMDDFVVNFSH